MYITMLITKAIQKISYWASRKRKVKVVQKMIGGNNCYQCQIGIVSDKLHK
jgi:hypothetical protein